VSERVLVTGAGGFIGSHLAADQLRRGRTVVAVDLHLDRLAPLGTRAGLERIEGDVADPEVQARAVRGVDTVFHLAAAHLGASVPASEFDRINVSGVKTLVDASAAERVRRFVHCSSVGVYGEVADPPYDEDSPCRPELDYERTKLAGERVVLEAAKAGFPGVVLRPAWVYGPGCPRTEKLFRSIGKGRFFLVGKADTLRHCVYIRDMVDAFELAARSDAALGKVFVIADAGAVPVRDLVREIARLTGAPMPRTVPAPLFLAGAVALEAAFGVFGKEPPVSRRTMRFFTGNTAFDISRARSVLGYEPRWDFARGLEETAAILARGPFHVPLPERAAP
jgi:nucleoside-diphosphate-sugar epimerase